MILSASRFFGCKKNILPTNKIILKDIYKVFKCFFGNRHLTYADKEHGRLSKNNISMPIFMAASIL